MIRTAALGIAPGLALVLACAGCAPAQEPSRMPALPPGAGVGIGASNSANVPAPGSPMGRPYQVGLATWYGGSFAGKKTSNGERFDPGAMTAAHRRLPFNTWVEVCRVETGTCVRVRINDRGPWGDDRKVIDLSFHAAQLLGYVDEGATKVEIRVVGGP